MWQMRFEVFRVLAVAALLLGAKSADGHQLWLETAAVGRTGESHPLHVCWGSPGNKETEAGLARQQGKLSAYWARPGGEREVLDLGMGSDSFTASFTPNEPGYHRVGGEIQIGILTREFHGIAAGTRLVMYGTSSVRVECSEQGLDECSEQGLDGCSEQGLDSPLGLDLEIIPTRSPRDLRPGDLVEVKVLFQGEPVGDQLTEVSLSTMGPESFSDRAQERRMRWSVTREADPATGTVRFPLIVPGQHVFYLQYMDETPGRYEGDLQFTTDYSRLSRGDTYERTLYICTFTLDVTDNATLP